MSTTSASCEPLGVATVVVLDRELHRLDAVEVRLVGLAHRAGDAARVDARRRARAARRPGRGCRRPHALLGDERAHLLAQVVLDEREEEDAVLAAVRRDEFAQLLDATRPWAAARPETRPRGNCAADGTRDRVGRLAERVGQDVDRDRVGHGHRLSRQQAEVGEAAEQRDEAVEQAQAVVALGLVGIHDQHALEERVDRAAQPGEHLEQRRVRPAVEAARRPCSRRRRARLRARAPRRP